MSPGDRQQARVRESFCAEQFEKGLAQAVDAAYILLKVHFVLRHGLASPTERPNRVDPREATADAVRIATTVAWTRLTRRATPWRRASDVGHAVQMRRTAASIPVRLQRGEV